MDLIYFHKNCPDGWCAALIAKRRYPEAEIVGLNHGEKDAASQLVQQVKDKSVLMVDFSLRTRTENVAVHDSAKSFRIYDHHKTAEAELEGLDFCVFDMKRSGAQITWDETFGKYDKHFYDSGMEIQIGPNRRMYIGMPEPQRPWYVDYVGDRDLWKWELPRSKEVNSYIMVLPFTETAWRVLETISPEQAAKLGEGALAHVQHYVREVVEHRQLGQISYSGIPNAVLDGYTVAVVNAPYLNISEVGNVLASQYADIGLGWFERHDGLVQFSLRSNGDIDVSKIATLHGGGGHKNAAGFQMTLKQSRIFLDSILDKS